MENDKWKVNDDKLLSFSKIAKGRVWKILINLFDFLRYSFGRVKVTSTSIERVCTPDNTVDLH